MGCVRGDAEAVASVAEGPAQFKCACMQVVESVKQHKMWMQQQNARLTCCHTCEASQARREVGCKARLLRGRT